MRKVLEGTVLLCLMAGLVQGPAATPSAQADETSHHACLAEEREALERGQGFGMALVADRNGYPGPRHLLDLKQRLHLSADQEQEMQELFGRMQTRAVAVGKELLGKETELDRLFAGGEPEEANVRRLLSESAALRAELRWVHLSAHLEARRLLTPEQRAHYHALRYQSAQHAH